MVLIKFWKFDVSLTGGWHLEERRHAHQREKLWLQHDISLSRVEHQQLPGPHLREHSEPLSKHEMARLAVDDDLAWTREIHQAAHVPRNRHEHILPNDRQRPIGNRNQSLWSPHEDAPGHFRAKQKNQLVLTSTWGRAEEFLQLQQPQRQVVEETHRYF